MPKELLTSWPKVQRTKLTAYRLGADYLQPKLQMIQKGDLASGWSAHTQSSTPTPFQETEQRTGTSSALCCQRNRLSLPNSGKKLSLSNSPSETPSSGSLTLSSCLVVIRWSLRGPSGTCGMIPPPLSLTSSGGLLPFRDLLSLFLTESQTLLTCK